MGKPAVTPIKVETTKTAASQIMVLVTISIGPGRSFIIPYFSYTD